MPFVENENGWPSFNVIYIDLVLPACNASAPSVWKRERASCMGGRREREREREKIRRGGEEEELMIYYYRVIHKSPSSRFR
jgi:hypothetical protein